jgi:nucleoside-diphosphate kinase
MKERTLVIIKPDAIQKGTAGEAFSRLETLRLDILAAKAIRPSRGLAEEHYQHLRGKPFFEELIDHITGKLHRTNYVLAFVLYGNDAIARVREITGATDPEKADPRSIRGALGRTKLSGLMENVVHASSDAADVEREIALWFRPDEILDPAD